MAMFQFMGGEIVLVTAGEAKHPMRDLPIAARYMYLLPVSFYLVAILFVGLNVNYLDPRIYHSHVSNYLQSRLEGIQTAERSPFVVAIENAGIKSLPGFLDACFLFSALTAA
jgi:amino acid transporter